MKLITILRALGNRGRVVTDVQIVQRRARLGQKRARVRGDAAKDHGPRD